jgi:hypothetical protein
METAQKAFPANYSNRILEIIKALSMSGTKGIKILGSASIRSQLYAGDFDINNIVNMGSVKEIADELKDIIKRLRAVPECYIGDIKIGEIPEWNPFRPSAMLADKKIENFNIKESQSIIDSIPASAISQKERSDALNLLEKATTPKDFLTAKKEIKFHILRWKPEQILAGYLNYRGLTVTLQEAIMSRGLIKIDVVALVNSRYVEIAMVYSVSVKGSPLMRRQQPLLITLTEDFAYYSKIDPFKSVKRLFSIAKLTGDKKAIEKIVPILNSDLGRLYQIVSDLKVLKGLMERPQPPIQEIRSQIDDMRSRMGNIYQLKLFLDKEHDIIGELNTILNTPLTAVIGKIVKLITKLQGIIDEATVKIMKTI